MDKRRSFQTKKGAGRPLQMHYRALYPKAQLAMRRQAELSRQKALTMQTLGRDGQIKAKVRRTVQVKVRLPRRVKVRRKPLVKVQPESVEFATKFLSSFILKKFVAQIMRDGKKCKSEKIFKQVLVKLSLKGHSPANTVVLAINNVKPVVDVRTIRRRGKKFQVPVPLKPSRQVNKAIQTLISVSKNKIFFIDFLVDELINSMRGRSKSLKLTKRLHRLAFKNRAFANYRWF